MKEDIALFVNDCVRDLERLSQDISSVMTSAPSRDAWAELPLLESKKTSYRDAIHSIAVDRYTWHSEHDIHRWLNVHALVWVKNAETARNQALEDSDYSRAVKFHGHVLGWNDVVEIFSMRSVAL